MDLALSRLREQVSTADLRAVAPVAEPPRGWYVAMLAVVNVPVAVATGRALSRGWQPLGDAGILLVRARDVGTSHNPLLGSWTSASIVLGQQMNNPGPLYSDAIALPVKLLGPWVGLAVGVMLVNIAASTLAVVVAGRICGVESMVAVAAVVAGLQWALGSELLFDVWQPNALVLPMLAYLVVSIGLATGDLRLAPWWVGLASLLVQTHLGYGPIVALMSLAVVVITAAAIRRRGTAPAWRRPLGWTLVVVVLAWAQPLVEQVTGPGRGNLTRILGSVVHDDPQGTIGLARALRITAEATVVDPWFTRGSYDGAVPLTRGDVAIPGLVPLVPGVTIVAVALAAAVAVPLAGRRWSRPGLAAMGCVSAAALAAAVVALAVSPVNVIGISVHQMRWLWPVAAVVTATLLTGLLTVMQRRVAAGRRALAAVAGVAVIVALANLPTDSSTSLGPASLAGDLKPAQELVGGLAALEGRGTVLFDPVGLRYSEPYTGLVFAELQDRSIPFVFDDEGLIRQFGEGRRDHGDAVLRLWQVEGAAAVDPPPGAERVGFSSGRRVPVALLVEPLTD